MADGKLPESNIHEMAADTRSADDIADVMDQADSDDASVRAAADAANDALLDDVASDYERELVNELGPEPVIDLMILGMGPDGHYASLFPGHDEVKVTDRLTVGVNHSPKMPPLRVSLTAPLIARSRHTGSSPPVPAKPNRWPMSSSSPTTRITRPPTPTEWTSSSGSPPKKPSPSCE